MLISQTLNKAHAYVTSAATGSISRGGGRQEGATLPGPAAGVAQVCQRAPLLTADHQGSKVTGCGQIYWFQGGRAAGAGGRGTEIITVS